MYCVPQSLVMRVQDCDYCRGVAVLQISAGHLIGILACRQHETDARRDCDADLHKRRRVRLTDARKALPELFSLLPPSFPVARTDGSMEEGWFVPPNSYPRRYLSYFSGSGWALPVSKEEGDDEIIKCVPLTELEVPGVSVAVIQRATAILDAGIYKAAADAQDCIGVMEQPFPDHPSIRAGVNKDGVLGRILA